MTDADVAKLAASRPDSATPKAESLNALGFKAIDKFGNTFIAAPYRLGKTFYTIKARNVVTKEFFQENAVSQAGLFNIDAVKDGDDVYVVESELDAAMLHQFGYVAVSVINGKQKQIELEVLNRLKKAGRIFLVGDQDAPGQICMNNLAPLLPPEKTFRMNFEDAKDIGELVIAWDGLENFLGTFNERWDKIRATSMASWVSKNVPFISQLSDKPQEWIVDRLLPENGYLLVTGKFGGQKSLSALHMAHGIATGEPVWGREVLRPTPVLYIDRENPQATVSERRTRLGMPPNVVHYWGDWTEGAETPNLDDPRIEEFAVREKGVIVFDSLTDWLEGESENDPSKMTEISRKLRRLARLGAGVIVLHHDNKNGVGYRGSTAIPAGSDMAIKMEKNEATGVVQVRTERFRMTAAWEIDFRVDFTARPYTFTILKDVLVGERVRQEATDHSQLVSEILAEYHESHEGEGMTRRELEEAIQDRAMDMPRAKIRQLMASGKTSGRWVIYPGPRNATLYRLAEWELMDEAA